MKPGVYLMRDARGGVLYVGKAFILRNRLRSYFGPPSDLSVKTIEMMPQVADFEYIVTDSETEALLLENNLIKKHKPRFNIRLKDDKNYPYIKINLAEDYPRVDFTRRVVEDGARYFGPFASAHSLRQTMALLKRLFPYRSCTKAITGTDVRPCLDFYIKRCVGPCIGAVSKEEYREVIDEVILFLEGKHEKVLHDLRKKMELASEGLQFERAALLRDQVHAIEKVAEEQKAVSLAMGDEDIIALAEGGNEAWVEVFFIRKGNLIGRDHFILEGTEKEGPPQIITGFVKQYYASALFVPPSILLQHPVEDEEVLGEWLGQRRGARVYLRVPSRGEKRKLVDLVAKNAKEGLDLSRVKWMADRDAVAAALEDLQEQLGLPAPPKRIECYDISNIMGTSAVGSMVTFENGQPKNSHFRRFKIKAVEGVDDYAMMQEMLRRRFKRLGEAVQNPQEAEQAKQDGDVWSIVPDLVLIDGGKGHLNAALQVMLELGLDSMPLASIAKQFEELFVPDMPDPIVLPRQSQALYLLQRVRDEAHRFAITYHRALRSKRSLGSAMDEVPGIGPKRRKALLKRFGSVQAIREAPLDEIAAVVGMTRSLAQKVKDRL